MHPGLEVKGLIYKKNINDKYIQSKNVNKNIEHRKRAWLKLYEVYINILFVSVYNS